MSLLKEEELKQLAELIKQVESETNAELVTVIARQADNYLYVPTLFAAVIALIVPVVLTLTPYWLEASTLLLIQWITFFVLAALFRIPALMMRLIPKSVKKWRASNLARRQFLENNLHCTKDETGVLIFISEAEHYVEIIADRGINKLVAQEEWQSIVDQFVLSVKRGETAQGLADCIRQCGSILATHVPATSDKNELPNHLILI